MPTPAAQAWGRKFDRDRQVADYTTAVELDPANATYRLYRASAWAAQGQHDRAIADYDEAARVQPNNPEIFLHRGIEWENDARERITGHSARALADFDRATAIDGTYGNPYLERARIWQRRREFDKVIAGVHDADRARSHPPAGASGARVVAGEL